MQIPYRSAPRIAYPSRAEAHKDEGRADRRAVAGPLGDLSREELIRVLDDADLIAPALGYRMATVPVFSSKGLLVPLASTGPAVGPDSRLLCEEGSPDPGLRDGAAERFRAVG